MKLNAMPSAEINLAIMAVFSWVFTACAIDPAVCSP